MKINERTILNKGCRICEQEYLSLFPALAVSYYSNKKGLKAELDSDRLLGVPLETYIPSEKLAIESGSADENIEIMKAYMCEQRGIRLIKLPMKGTELDYNLHRCWRYIPRQILSGQHQFQSYWMKDIIVDECCIQGVACHIIKEL